MRIILFSFLFIILITNCYTQLETPPRELVNNFLNTTLNVIVNPMSLADKTLKEVVLNFWQINKTRIINISEYEQLKNDTSMSFISIEEVQYEKKENSTYKMLIISLGGFKDKFNDSKIIFSFPIAAENEDDEDYAYKLKPLILFTQKHIKNIAENPELKKITISSFYNKNSKLLKHKTLLIDKNILENKLQNNEYFQKKYPYKFEITTAENIENAIENCEKNTAFIHTVSPPKNSTYRFYIYVLDVCDGTLYFTDFHHTKNKPAKVLEEQIKKIVAYSL
ncbi:MAG: hypothetical protein N3A01_02425 [Bacteroidales bacterium]|nr:hypothetical protein [Bacteroidales bacterium]